MRGGGLVTINNNKEELQAAIIGPNQSLATNMILPIEHAHSPFQYSEANKAMILLSDGWHWIREEDTETPPYPDNLIHSEITTNYNPYAITCHTLCYEQEEDIGNNKTDWDHMPYDAEATKLLMQNIADWGNGQAYHRSSVDSSFVDIKSLISDIRNKPLVAHKTGSFTETPVVDLSFSVDSGSHSLRIDYSLDMYTVADPISFGLTSPSGVIYTNDSGVHNVYCRVGVIEIAYPENGLWSISLERSPNALELELFNISVELESDIIIDFNPLANKVPYDEALYVSAAVYDYKTPVTDAIVEVRIQRGDWSVYRSLFDDGTHHDNFANDGVYANNINIYYDAEPYFEAVSGDYYVTYELNVPSLSVQREKTYKITIVAPDDSMVQDRRLMPGWNWIGFPRLIRDGYSDTIDNVTSTMVPDLNTIESRQGYAVFEDYWHYYGLNDFNSKEGYKLRISNGNEIAFREVGTLIDTTSVYHLNEEWNWITYPCATTVYPEEALVSVIDYIDYVRAEIWSMQKIAGEWIYDGGSRRPVLRYGESIEVRATEDCELSWNSDQERPYVKPIKSKYYTFEDKSEYETIIVESIDGCPDFHEIGVFQEGICLGARVFEEYPIQILVYSDPENVDSELEFFICADSKVQRRLKVVNILGDTKDDNALYPEPGSFRRVSFVEVGDKIPTVFAIEPNFPNPFNPLTNISFSIPSSSKVRLTVYNVKGQKIKNLLNDTLDQGRHTIQWDGTDHRKRSVSSGLYFARLENTGKSRTIKMMLMK